MKTQSLIFSVIIIAACTSTPHPSVNAKDSPSATQKIIKNDGTSIESRFFPPPGYIRNFIPKDSFGNYLRRLPLKEINAKVKYFNGTEKVKQGVYCSVIDLPIGTKDLHQCADGVMHVWGKYLFENKRYNDIQFKFLNDERWHNFATWSGGNYSEKNFYKYMEQVWSAANTRSLFGQLKSIRKEEVRIGDVLIVKGQPYGHAIIVVDECIQKSTGKKMYMLAQSYMPAQELQILINPSAAEYSPWYSFDLSETIETPEWDFTIHDFRRF
jgi:hypothetical protein